MIELGVRPVFVHGFVDDATWTRDFARTMEQIGVESVWGNEHVVVAKNYEPRYPYSADGRMPAPPGVVMPDPLEWLSFVAGVTDHIKLGTSVMVVTLQSPAVLAKRVATLDRLSGGRVLFGVGSGWQIEEYQACGVPYDDRGRRLDETITVLRELWQPGYRTHRGELFAFEEVESTPMPVQVGGPPIIIGGSSPAAARRAGRIGDGFHPHAVSPEELGSLLETMRAAALSAGRDPSAIEVTAWPASWRRGVSLDLPLMRRYAELGVHRLMVAAQESGSCDVDDIRDFVLRVQDEVIAKL
jgi:probable F420-dependent oxidoreductase